MILDFFVYGLFTMKNLPRHFVLLCSLALSACVTHTSLPNQDRPIAWATAIQEQTTNKKLPDNLHKVAPLLYRSALPKALHGQGLATLGIGTVINLRQTPDPVALSEKGITLVHLPIDTWAVDKYDILATMRAIQAAKAQGKPALIHCYHGSDRTGVMVAMYRILFQNWTTEQALYEMKYGGYGYHPIWVNLPKLFDDETIGWLRGELGL